MESTKDIDDLFDDIPLALNPFHPMTQPNERIPIYQGEIVLKDGPDEYIINGAIYFDWTPSPRTHFSGIYLGSQQGAMQLFQSQHAPDVYIRSENIGPCWMTGINTISNSDRIELKGSMNHNVVMGDQTIRVSSVCFSVPNLRSFLGASIRRITPTGRNVTKGRLKFDTDEYSITIDPVHHFKELMNDLKQKGGFCLLHEGELTKKNGSLTFEEAESVLKAFGCFLSFLNGTMINAFFMKGLHEGEMVWQDFSSHNVAHYKSVYSWTPHLSIAGLDRMWLKFWDIWQNEEDESFLSYTIHWYTETNVVRGFAEGSIVLAQTALELIYNWLLIEKRKLLIGKDAENISAANKIRMLLAQISASTAIPESFEDLQALISKQDEAKDAPEKIVQIRNAIVHSQLEKRKKLSEFSDMARIEALQVYRWYIELSLLYILDYDGIYVNHCINDNKHKNQCIVPWAVNNKSADPC